MSAVPRGLDRAAVTARMRAGQVNTAPPAAGRSVGQILRANVLTRFNAILGVLFVVVLVVGPPQDALFGAVLVANTTVGVVQEFRARRTLDRLAILTAARARVVRDGVVAEIGVEQVVLDDVLELHPGDQVPVDAVVLGGEGLELDEALLSGETEPVAKEPGDRVLSGSFVAAGTGWARAAAVGEACYAVQLQAHARRFSLIRSELQQGTNQILRMVTWVMVPAGLLLVISQLFRSHAPLEDAVRGSVGGVSAMVPEGLVLLTSIAFAAGAIRLARRRVLVQELAAIEGLARVDVLCIDKTGTLTKPGMRLEGIEVLPGAEAGQVRDAVGAIAAADPAPNATMRALAAASDPPIGWAVASRAAFSSARKWSAVTFTGHGTWVLGAPGVVGGDLPVPAAAAVARREADGRRVVLLGRTTEPADSGRDADAAVVAKAATPVALLILAEELRDDAAQTVRYLRDQGVTIKVLSGDAPGAAAAIAARAGVCSPGPPRDASGLGDDESSVAAAIREASVLGRVRPAQKLAAVRALQAAGHVVAMVGDGVNDVQALKQADLGIAVGSGSQASRSVARIVLLDSTFAAVPQVLEEGRRVIANIERVAGLFVTKTAYAALIAVVIGITALPFPFFPRHLTIVSTLTIGIPGFFLALAAGAPRAQPGFTRRVLAFTIPAGLIAGTAVLASYAIVHAMPATTAAQQRTAAMLVLFAIGWWILALVAGRPDAGRIALLAVMAAALAVIFAVPAFRRVFGLEFPPPPAIFTAVSAAAAAIIALTLWRRFGPGPTRATKRREASMTYRLRERNMRNGGAKETSSEQPGGHRG